MTIGERIRERRKELHMTLEDVTRQTGIPKSTVQRWESGAVTNMGQESLRKVAAALNTSVPYLQTGVSVEVKHIKHPEAQDADVLEFLRKKSGYTCSARSGSSLVYSKANSEFVTLDEKSNRELLDQVIHYFGYLMHERSESLEAFLEHYQKE